MTRQFGAFTASELYCPKCKRAQAVREKLLLVLPSGELHEFLCTGCGTSLAKRTVSGPSDPVTKAATSASPRTRADRGRLLN